MQTRVMATLNGVSLHDVDNRIIIQGIDEAAPSWAPTALSRAGRIGQRYTGTEKRYRDVTVRFVLRVIGDVEEREKVIQAAAAWAVEGGELTVNYRTGEKLNVVCITPPMATGIGQWATVYQMVFRAYGIPDWVNEVPDGAKARGQSGNVPIVVSSNGGGKLEAEISNNSGSTCNTLSFTANGQTMAFANLGLQSGQSLAISYDDEDIQSIKIGSDSAMAKRTTASADDIWMHGDGNIISYTAECALTWDFSCRGRWHG